MTAFAPLVYLVALVLLGLAAATLARGRATLLGWSRWRSCRPSCCCPWLPTLVDDPSLLLLEAGLPGPGLTDDRLAAPAVFLLHPGGPGMYPLLLTIGVLLAALAGLLRRDRRRLVLAGWSAAVVGLAAALVQTRVSVGSPTLEATVPAWSGPVLLVAGAGLVVAAAIGAEGARARLAGDRLRLAAAGCPAAHGRGRAGAGAGGRLVAGRRRRRPAGSARPRACCRPSSRPRGPSATSRAPWCCGRAAVTGSPTRCCGPTVRGSVTPRRPTSPTGATGLDRAVADLGSGRGGDAAAALLPYGVRFVLMTTPLNRDLARDIDAVAGLVRVSGPQGSLVWRVQYPSGRVRVLPSRGADPADATVLPAGPVGARGRIELGSRRAAARGRRPSQRGLARDPRRTGPSRDDVRRLGAGLPAARSRRQRRAAL